MGIRTIELLLSPAALASITIFVLFLICLGVFFLIHNAHLRRRLLVASCSSGSLASASSSCKWKLGPFSVKVIREANVLYPVWTQTNNDASTSTHLKQTTSIAYSSGSGFRQPGGYTKARTNSVNTPDSGVMPSSLFSSVEVERKKEGQASSPLLQWQDKRCVANCDLVDSIPNSPNR